jgi:hypothetical protein
MVRTRPVLFLCYCGIGEGIGEEPVQFSFQAFVDSTLSFTWYVYVYFISILEFCTRT